MATYVTPKINTAFICYVALPSQADSNVFQSNPTLATGDAKVSIDGGALADLATLPDVDPNSSKAVKVALSAGEMNGANIQVILSDAAGAEWADVFINIQTTARQIDDLAFPLTSGRGELIGTDGSIAADLIKILGTAITETAGQIAAAFTKFFNKATPTGTINSIPDAVAGAAGGIAIVGSNMGTVTSVSGAVGSVTGAVGSVTGNVGGNVTGSVGSVVGAVGSVTGNVGGNVTGSVGSLATQAKADVNAEVVDCLNVDTYAEPTGVPAATATLANKIGRLYQVLRNKMTVTNTAKTFTNDAGTALWSKTLSDNGTTYTEDEGA